MRAPCGKYECTKYTKCAIAPGKTVPKLGCLRAVEGGQVLRDQEVVCRSSLSNIQVVTDLAYKKTKAG
ncbi:hypothetical protein GOODEAATRI_034545 [Goodea atripinnis]|uniref:Uncharacterized protein n=1 Tax=Goodea atripinnis TaxID=208336 RepID=A0ABV0N7K3_9TELE